MANQELWFDFLDQQYARVINSDSGRPLLFAVRKFVKYLETDPQAQLYVKELERQWELANVSRRKSFNAARSQALKLEKKINETSAKLDRATKNLPQLPDTPHYGTINSLDIFQETNLSQKAANHKDDLVPQLIDLNNSKQSQTGYICSEVWSFAQRLNLLAQSIKVNQEAIAELFTQTDTLFRHYIALRNKLSNDWVSSGGYALEQLQVIVKIVDGELFVDPANFKFQKMRELSQWKTLMLEYAPRNFHEKIKSALFNVNTDYPDYKEDVEPLIKRYLGQIYGELNNFKSKPAEDLSQADDTKSASYGPHLDTQEKLERLREHRKELKLKGQLRRTFTNSCQLVGIDPKTVKKHAPELRQHWEDRDY